VFDPQINYKSTETVKLMTLDEVLQEADTSDQIDFLSIDTEGTELDILQGFNIEKYKPSLIIVEYHVYSLKLHKYLKKHNYKLIKRIRDNNWYVRKDIKIKIGIFDRLKLFRKMYLGTPLRKIKLFFKSRRSKST
jgi:hypothetical protein